jgi:hypothetical protein
MRTILGGGIEEGTLQRCHRPVGGTLAPAGDAREGILGRGAKGGARAGGDNGPARREISASESRSSVMDMNGLGVRG